MPFVWELSVLQLKLLGYRLLVVADGAMQISPTLGIVILEEIASAILIQFESFRGLSALKFEFL